MIESKDFLNSTVINKRTNRREHKWCFQVCAKCIFLTFCKNAINHISLETTTPVENRPCHINLTNYWKD